MAERSQLDFPFLPPLAGETRRLVISKAGRDRSGQKLQYYNFTGGDSMKFTLEIELGKSMQTYEDIALAILAEVAVSLSKRHTVDAGDSDRIRDKNGSIVGEWRVVTA